MFYLHEYIPQNSRSIFLVSRELDPKEAAAISYQDGKDGPNGYLAFSATLYGDYWKIGSGTKEEMQKRKAEEEELSSKSEPKWRFYGDDHEA